MFLRIGANLGDFALRQFDKTKGRNKRKPPPRLLTFILNIQGDVLMKARQYGYYAVYSEAIPELDEPEMTIMHIKATSSRDARKIGREFGRILQVRIL